MGSGLKLRAVKASLVALTLAMAALFGGCQHTASEPIQGPIFVQRPVYDAEGPVWVLYHLNDKPFPVAPVSAGFRLLSKNSHVYGTSGLNQFSGEYWIDYGVLRFKPLATTKRAGTPEQMALEQDLLATLGRVTSWRVQANILILLADTKPVAYLMRHPEQPAAN